MRLSFNLMIGNECVLQSYPITYFRVIGGKIVFQSSNDYRVHSFSLIRVSNVEIKEK